ncbi:serine/threonine-protein kinase [Acidisoma cladoniae]|jgi:hypothetical protein|uniref:serine/threonine-protein kinase n=1 Tax=Acidisoma cladoniae TaxID=3040935 RepID=UPI00255129E1|nr:serine/threonine-protein kinase [Acidisoma sp. PAMC 29798]
MAVGTVAAAGWHLSFARQGAAGAQSVLTADPDTLEPAHGVKRGLLAAVAQGLDAGRDPSQAGRSADLALTGLIEGFFSARPTLSQGRAAAQALNAINGWMFATHGTEALEPGYAASLSAITFSGLRAGLVQIGAGMILRRRAGELVRLTGPHLLRVGAEHLRPRRCLGMDDRILLDFVDDTPQPADRYILLSDARSRMDPAGTLDQDGIVRLCTLHEEAAVLAAHLSEGCAVLVIDVLAMPDAALSPVETETNLLPLRPIPQEGDNRDGYQIGRTIHRGAYTLLKRAIDTRTGQAVVLKFPLPAMLNDRVFQAGFAREAWIGATIHSPLIGRIITPEPGRQSSLYIVMPFYAGETLEARLAREPRFPVADIVAIGLQLCQAVEDLHAVQVFHRDLKPDNIMVQSGGAVRLLDLGLAYLSQADASSGNDLAGTLRYMAPEAIRGGAPDATTEVFALGIILYRMAAFGRFPRPGTETDSVLERARPDLPASLRRAIAAALSLDRTARPQTAALLADAITPALHEDSVTPPPTRRRLSDVALWRAATVALALAILALLALR